MVNEKMVFTEGKPTTDTCFLIHGQHRGKAMLGKLPVSIPQGVPGGGCWFCLSLVVDWSPRRVTLVSVCPTPGETPGLPKDKSNTNITNPNAFTGHLYGF